MYSHHDEIANLKSGAKIIIKKPITSTFTHIGRIPDKVQFFLRDGEIMERCKNIGLYRSINKTSLYMYVNIL